MPAQQPVESKESAPTTNNSPSTFGNFMRIVSKGVGFASRTATTGANAVMSSVADRASLFNNRIQFASGKYQHHSTIIPGLVLGAIPVESNRLFNLAARVTGGDTKPESEQLIEECAKRQQPLKLVLTILEEFERREDGLLIARTGSSVWQRFNVKHLAIDCVDRDATFSAQELHAAIQAMHHALTAEQGTAMVHCRSGMGRSYTVVLAYLTTAFTVANPGLCLAKKLGDLAFDAAGNWSFGNTTSGAPEARLKQVGNDIYLIDEQGNQSSKLRLDADGNLFVGTPGQPLTIAEARLHTSLIRPQVGVYPSQLAKIQEYHTQCLASWHQLHHSESEAVLRPAVTTITPVASPLALQQAAVNDDGLIGNQRSAAGFDLATAGDHLNDDELDDSNLNENSNAANTSQSRFTKEETMHIKDERTLQKTYFHIWKEHTAEHRLARHQDEEKRQQAEKIAKIMAQRSLMPASSTTHKL